jgi:hypothetical protein
MRKLLGWLWRYRWMLALFAFAFGLRLAWNHWIHQPQKYVYSDMSSYVARAQRLIDQPFGRFTDEAFYPFGTHYVLAACLLIWGKTNLVAAATWWALMSALLSPIAYFMGGRLSGGAGWSELAHGPRPPVVPPDGASSEERDRFDHYAMGCAVARVAGLFIAIYYPLFSYTGYFLSELPFALCVSACALFALQLVDHGRTRDAVWLGLSAAVGTAIRPQLLVAIGMLLLFIAWRRTSFPTLKLWRLAIPLVPITMVVGFSLVHSKHHTGRYSVLAQNGALNRAFGRCHNIEMRAKRAMFGPPAFGALLRSEQRNPGQWIALKPAIDPKLRIKGHMWDEDELNDLADRCVAETGLLRQAYFAVTHVVLLWGYNVSWPDMGAKPYRYHMRGWIRAHLIVFMIPALMGMAMGVNRRWPRHGVLAIFLWSMVLTVMLVMGSSRFRVPYDLISIVLGLAVYASVATRLFDWWRRRRAAANMS